MATALDDLEARVAALEEKLERLVAGADGSSAQPHPEMTPLQRFIAERRVTWSAEEIAALRMELGIPADLPHIGAEAVQQMMLDEGVNPDDCILSSEIIRVRNETRA